MRASAACVLLALGALALGACGGLDANAMPFRIGILTDCYGAFNGVHDAAVASAEIPLLARHGRLRGDTPAAGVEGATAAGRPVELIQGCATGDDELLLEARRLVEEEHADVVIGPLFPQGGLVLRQYARLRPETTFVIQPSDAPELTLTDPAPNVFRFVADAAQGAAGLGSYAYRILGWRTAETIGDDVPYGWATASGFVAEFCALGGKVAQPKWVFGADPAPLAARIPSSVDGVFLGTALAPAAGFLRRYAARRGDLRMHVVASATVLADPEVGGLAKGVVVANNLPFQSPAETAYVAAFKRDFPRLPAKKDALNSLAFPYRDGVEAALEALGRTGGKGGRSLQAALARLELDSPSGRIHLDRNHQAVVPIYLGQVDAAGRVRTIEVKPRVEQTFGGYFKAHDPPATETTSKCVKHKPPAWAR